MERCERILKLLRQRKIRHTGIPAKTHERLPNHRLLAIKTSARQRICQSERETDDVGPFRLMRAGLEIHHDAGQYLTGDNARKSLPLE